MEHFLKVITFVTRHLRQTDELELLKNWDQCEFQAKVRVADCVQFSLVSAGVFEPVDPSATQIMCLAYFGWFAKLGQMTEKICRLYSINQPHLVVGNSVFHLVFLSVQGYHAIRNFLDMFNIANTFIFLNFSYSYL